MASKNKNTPSDTKKNATQFLENVTFDELTIGQTASIARTLTRNDIRTFAAVSGDINPAHLDEQYAKTGIFHSVIGHGMWSGALISSVLGTLLPGPGTIYLEQDIKFRKPVRVGDTVTVTVTVRSKRGDKPIVIFDCLCKNEHGETVAEGAATVLAPTEKIRIERPEMPELEVITHDRYNELIESCKGIEPLPTAVVHPVQSHVLEAVADAAKEELIIPTLIGPKTRILAAAKEAQIDISKWELIDTEHSHAAADKAVELIQKKKIEAIMKGSLHTDELLRAIVAPTSGLRTERRISHAFVINLPSYHKPLIVTDAAVNISPQLDAKADICQNAIDLWRTLFGFDKMPKVAIMAAVETVSSKMYVTLDAAALCKMADRGQITGGILDGPLAMDLAISQTAVAEKGITSKVAGDADILLMPNIESANMVSKQLSFLGHADTAGIVLGARAPIILTSRSDNVRARIMSCALAVKVAKARRDGLIK